VIVPSIDEEHPASQHMDEVIVRNAEAKAAKVAAGLASKESVVIGADTLVMLDEHVLGKPNDAAHAKQMLKMLSGKAHTVVTGLALVSPKFGKRAVAVRSQ